MFEQTHGHGWLLWSGDEESGSCVMPAAQPISGLFDLGPLITTSLNDALDLTVVEIYPFRRRELHRVPDLVAELAQHHGQMEITRDVLRAGLTRPG